MPLMAGARALAKTLFGNPTFVSYGPMPVTVKTPACPVVVSMPAVGSAGSWSVEARGNDVKALYLGTCGELLGYALTGAAVQERLALNKQLPPVLAELPQILSLKSPTELCRASAGLAQVLAPCHSPWVCPSLELLQRL